MVRTETARVMRRKLEHIHATDAVERTIGFELEHMLVWLESVGAEVHFSVRPMDAEQAIRIADLVGRLTWANLGATLEDIGRLSPVFLDQAHADD
ncbi:MAG TPA: hypothetical protein P5181_09905 [Dermatophilaceae bacterium]|nr:hypothetical protein [Dermatophilaceae bacterium]